MKVIPITQLSRIDFSVSSLFAIRQSWGENAVFKMENRRRQSAFLWFCGSQGEYILEDGSVLRVPQNALISIPETSKYSTRFFNKTNNSSTILLEFRLFDDEPFVLTDKITVLDVVEEGTKIAESLESLANIFAMPVTSTVRIKAEFYRLLDRLIAKAESRSINDAGIKMIEEGIRYLQNDERQALSIDQIARMCFVSSNYFRRLFKSYAGISPEKYRIQRKIEKAKSLLENTDLTVAQISYILNFSSPAYFCRVFKHYTNMTPGEYRAK